MPGRAGDPPRAPGAQNGGRLRLRIDTAPSWRVRSAHASVLDADVDGRSARPSRRPPSPSRTVDRASRSPVPSTTGNAVLRVTALSDAGDEPVRSTRVHGRSPSTAHDQARPSAALRRCRSRTPGRGTSYAVQRPGLHDLRILRRRGRARAPTGRAGRGSARGTPPARAPGRSSAPSRPAARRTPVEETQSSISSSTCASDGRAELRVLVDLEVVVGELAVLGQLLLVGEVLAVADLEVAARVDVHDARVGGR